MSNGGSESGPFFYCFFFLFFANFTIDGFFFFLFYQLPKYDYFYIDLNFLLHKAVNEKNGLPLEKVDDDFFSESRIFERILRQIETLHRIVPSKVLFLSIDGVAPRAKWATQRERRYLYNCYSHIGALSHCFNFQFELCSFYLNLV